MKSASKNQNTRIIKPKAKFFQFSITIQSYSLVVVTAPIKLDQLSVSQRLYNSQFGVVSKSGVAFARQNSSIETWSDDIIIWPEEIEGSGYQSSIILSGTIYISDKEYQEGISKTQSKDQTVVVQTRLSNSSK